MIIVPELPKVTYEKPYIIIEGKSIPADADDFYLGKNGLCNKIETCLKLWNKAIIEFKFDYYNTISSRYLTTLFVLLDKYSTIKDITINWYYKAGGEDRLNRDVDTDMKEYGEDYQELIVTKLNIIER
jgi:hypothetical protein